MQMLNQINNIAISPYFNLSEFACPCCKKIMLHPLLLEKLEKLRKIIERPVYITSGYRFMRADSVGQFTSRKKIQNVKYMMRLPRPDKSGLAMTEKDGFPLSRE